ncbi:uncharacterized protein LOC131014928 isoform X1 [Salvia miltiorrhiza]|uniref:uncharacterized protein LOC131014928 isoform X1 n=1 Tax=Salvia miltiorrhiza TaxID=226208 RepID=UPI0025AD954F|nr:uncharacterized protein LOC131014928 isoform X1 [Salvia miltiorrhiza]
MSDSKSAALGTTIKLNGSNYLLWSRAFLLFLGSQKKKTHVLSDPVASTDLKYDAWSADDCAVMTWLLNSLEDSVSKNIMFLETAKAMWDTLRQMYSNDKNVSRVFELYEKLFSHTQSGQTVNDYFSTLKGLADEILVYHPLSCSVTQRATQWEEFMVAKFLSGLDADLRPVRDSLLSSDNVPSLSNALSRVLRVSTGRTDDATSPNSSAMAARGQNSHVSTSFSPSSQAVQNQNYAHGQNSYGGRGRGRSGERGRGRGRGSDRYCEYCHRTNHTSENCWKTFGKPGRAHTVVPDPQSSSSDDTVSLSRAQYDKLIQSINLSSGTAPSTSAASPIVASAGAFSVSHGSADEEDDWWRT